MSKVSEGMNRATPFKGKVWAALICFTVISGLIASDPSFLGRVFNFQTNKISSD